jgi:SAM-dependent methyltransferase
MERYGPSTYGDRIAEIYDSLPSVPPDAGDAVAFLADIVGGGPVLELGIGTGRIALPLAARGIEVHGVDASEAMVAKLREKPGGADLPITMGDFADVPVDGSFSLVFIVWNTIWALGSQDDQVRCVRNVAERLRDGGVFVVQAMVPDPSRFVGRQHVGARSVEVDEVTLEASRYDPATQRVASQIVALRADGIRLYPVGIRLVWPAELDLMARLAGLRLRERWGGWKREPFTGEGWHVSVYERG